MRGSAGLARGVSGSSGVRLWPPQPAIRSSMPTAATADFRGQAAVENRMKIMARSGQIRMLKEEYHCLFIDELIERHPNRWLCKEAKFKAREACGVRRT
jgi:hypothetical protein